MIVALCAVEPKLNARANKKGEGWEEGIFARPRFFATAKFRILLCKMRRKKKRSCICLTLPCVHNRFTPFPCYIIVLLGKKLREVRLKKNKSQGDVAKILSVHRSYISGLERGKRNPSLLTVQKLAKTLGIGADKLVGN